MGYGIHMLKLVDPFECHLPDYVKTNTWLKTILMASVVCVLFYWSLETAGIEFKEKYRNIPNTYLYL